MKRILFSGFGELAALTLDNLIKLAADCEIYVLSRDYDRMLRTSNQIRLINIQVDNYFRVRLIVHDLNDITGTVQILQDVQPDLIFHSATMFSWWRLENLSVKVRGALLALRSGFRTALHLNLTHKLMQALQLSGIPSLVINACYPDVVNPVLWKSGYPIGCGIGNIANVVPALRCAIAYLENTDVENIKLAMYGHHAIGYSITRYGETFGYPYLLRYWFNGQDISNRYSAEVVFGLVPDLFRRLGGLKGQSMTAASAAKILMLYLGKEFSNLHAPGVNGYEGGYAIDPQRRDIYVPPNSTLQELHRVNLQGQVLDGIQAINQDGSVDFVAEVNQRLYELIGYQAKRLYLKDVEDEANHLLECLNFYLVKPAE